MLSRYRLPEHIVDRIHPPGPCSQNQSLAEAYFLDFFRFNVVRGNVINSVLRPNQLSDCHKSIIPQGVVPGNKTFLRSSTSAYSWLLSMDYRHAECTSARELATFPSPSTQPGWQLMAVPLRKHCKPLSCDDESSLATAR